MTNTMNIAIFIDGPLAQEVKNLRDLVPTFQVQLPKRETVCWCDDERESITESDAELFTYYRVMTGNGIGLYSREQDPKAIVHALKAWVVTDLSNVDKLYYSCRDRRAYS